MLSLILLLFFNLQPPSYSIQLYKVDNTMKIYVEDVMVYQTPVIEGNPDNVEMNINLDEYLVSGKNNMRIELINGESNFMGEQSDVHWEIMYDLMKNDKIIYSIWEDGNDGKIGMVFEQNHEIIIE